MEPGRDFIGTVCFYNVFDACFGLNMVLATPYLSYKDKRQPKLSGLKSDIKIICFA